MSLFTKILLALIAAAFIGIFLALATDNGIVMLVSVAALAVSYFTLFGLRP